MKSVVGSGPVVGVFRVFPLAVALEVGLAVVAVAAGVAVVAGVVFGGGAGAVEAAVLVKGPGGLVL